MVVTIDPDRKAKVAFVIYLKEYLHYNLLIIFFTQPFRQKMHPTGRKLFSLALAKCSFCLKIMEAERGKQ